MTRELVIGNADKIFIKAFVARLIAAAQYNRLTLRIKSKK